MTINITSISIIIPVLHEKHLDSSLARLEHLQDFGSCEIIVVDGSNNDDILKKISKPSIQTLTTRAGRGHQMNTGARHAHGDILLFLHADTTLPPNAIPLILHTMSDQRISAGAFRLAIDTAQPALHLIALLTTLRSRLTRIPFGDQAIFIRKDVFNSLGRYRDIPLMEDVDLMRRLRRTHHRIIILPAAVLTSARRWERDGIILGTLRNWTLRILYYLGIPPHRLTPWYR